MNSKLKDVSSAIFSNEGRACYLKHRFRDSSKSTSPPVKRKEQYARDLLAVPLAKAKRPFSDRNCSGLHVSSPYPPPTSRMYRSFGSDDTSNCSKFPSATRICRYFKFTPARTSSINFASAQSTMAVSSTSRREATGSSPAQSVFRPESIERHVRFGSRPMIRKDSSNAGTRDLLSVEANFKLSMEEGRAAITSGWSQSAGAESSRKFSRPRSTHAISSFSRSNQPIITSFSRFSNV
mmetsp:Transcript_2007/g.5402  ORF Transcript_2007/g.5402 Transcript_2007/m.5402 type:complete len:237 (-) Transcript_2007:443-1153(-)